MVAKVKARSFKTLSETDLLKALSPEEVAKRESIERRNILVGTGVAAVFGVLLFLPPSFWVGKSAEDCLVPIFRLKVRHRYRRLWQEVVPTGLPMLVPVLLCRCKSK